MLAGQPDASLCSNCGAGNSAIDIPEAAIQAIRKNASWVGKRYYPANEDWELQKEIQLLRLKMPEPVPGRSAKQIESGWWRVSQMQEDEVEISVSVEAESSEDALLKAKPFLPYAGEVPL